MATTLSYSGYLGGAAVQFPKLVAQPFGYLDGGVLDGKTARQWTLTGLLTPEEYIEVVNLYDTWRDVRILEEVTSTSLAIGSTINFSGTGMDGVVWTNIPCWFTSAPSATRNGFYLSVSVTVVDANQQLAVIIQDQADSGAEDDSLPDIGTYTINGVVLTLKKVIEAYNTGPQLTLTAAGTHYLTGATVVEKLRDIEGCFTTDIYPNGWSDIITWYEQQISTNPNAGTYFPVSSPTATVKNKIIGGIVYIEYTVNITLGEVL